MVWLLCLLVGYVFAVPVHNYHTSFVLSGVILDDGDRVVGDCYNPSALYLPVDCGPYDSRIINAFNATGGNSGVTIGGSLVHNEIVMFIHPSTPIVTSPTTSTKDEFSLIESDTQYSASEMYSIYKDIGGVDLTASGNSFVFQVTESNKSVVFDITTYNTTGHYSRFTYEGPRTDADIYSIGSSYELYVPFPTSPIFTDVDVIEVHARINTKLHRVGGSNIVSNDLTIGTATGCFYTEDAHHSEWSAFPDCTTYGDPKACKGNFPAHPYPHLPDFTPPPHIGVPITYNTNGGNPFTVR